MASIYVSQTVADMRRYYDSGETRPVSFRIEQLRKLKSMIRSHEDEIVHALYNDLKKPPFESYASEIGIMYVEIEHAIRHVKSWSRQGEWRRPSFIFCRQAGSIRSLMVPRLLWVHGIIHFIC